MAAIESVLQQWLASASGLPSGWVHQQRAAPPFSPGYGTLQLVDWQATGWAPGVDYLSVPGDMEHLRRTRRRTGTLSVLAQLFTAATVGETSAFGLLIAAREALDSPDTYEAMGAVGLGLNGARPVRNLTGLVGVEWQGRAALELSFLVDQVSEGLVDTIREVAVSHLLPGG